jgi:hypothetical protein
MIGRSPVYRKIDSLEVGETFTFPDDDIQLSGATTQAVTGTASINGADITTQFASISFRQDIGDGEMIEITSVDVLNSEGYDLNFPPGRYSVVAWTLGFVTQTHDLDIPVSDPGPDPVEKNINFPES